MTGQLIVLDRPHGKISPSMFARVMHCTASVPLTEKAPTRLAGLAAQTGTAAHALLERCLTEDLDTFELSDLETVRVDGAEVMITDEMLDQVQLALRWIRSNMAPPLLIEKQITLAFTGAPGRPPMAGWIDVASGPPWIVADYKSGFHSVEASSIQLGLYLLGLALEERPELRGEGHAGTAVVIQPRDSEPIRSHGYTWAELRQLKAQVRAVFDRIDRKDWTYADGAWCRWCPAAGFCPHLAAVARDAALAITVPTPELVATGEISNEALADWLDVIDRLEHWARSVNEVALDYVVHGGMLRNRKLVRKRVTRRWRELDERKAAAALEALGIDPWQRKVVTPAEAERRLPKTQRDVVELLSEKPPGELTLAPLNDPRTPIDAGASLRAALKSSVAAGYLAPAQRQMKE